MTFSLKRLLIASFTLLLIAMSPQLFAETPPSKTPHVLLVVSSYGKDQGKTQPGFEQDELSKAYWMFVDNGVTVDIASPNGGAVEADNFDPEQPYNKRFLNDQVAMKKLSKTLKIENLTSTHYQGVFVLGGKGAMFDLPFHQPLQSLIAKVYQSGGSIGAVCHGPAALVNVKLDNGNYLVANKPVNGFTNQEEQLFGKKWAKEFKFLLEDKLKQRNALFESSPMMLSHVAVADRLITGQNPTSTVDTVQAMLSSLKIQNTVIHQYQDDRTLNWVSQFLNNSEQAMDDYENLKSGFKIPLIAMYGYYFSLATESNEDQHSALKLLLLTQDEMKHPQLDLQIAKSQTKLGFVDQAKATLTKLIEKNPELEEAKTLLQTL
ncbi:type 1 glutamine amidotransferase domain-containing protein [Pleionea litopenaei]|uniref:Type 1 glutamine amidotransferase domain-containing protein n=1 Tax=Pleionea litopenaei TaxID=3070815 RepID=A0AA51RWJ8_9GAMM|nr:type 1 glutamine amidotransferase domain-containing protein [Pleionea sp. HL-JVS1]WMS88968.1 type 1 glutamine amidotransferase domain-containing protein [Pleionea sp. HL-JVS1]